MPEYKGNDIEGFMGRKELNYLYKNAYDLKDGSTIVEIGSWKGRSTEAFVEAIKDKMDMKLYCVDLWDEKYKINIGGNVYEEFMKNHSIWQKDFKVKPIIIRQSSAASALNFADLSIDLLFIDGAHDYNSVISDLKLLYPKVKIGGKICGHDFRRNVDGVRTAVIEFFGNKNFKCIPNTSIWERIKDGIN